MKVAVFSDVQGNLPAMEVTVEHILDWNPELVVMAGDLVNRGPSSRACLELFEPLRRERGWLPISGNHEAWVLRCGRERPQDALDAAMLRFADLTFRQIAPVAQVLVRDAVGDADPLACHGTVGDMDPAILGSGVEADMIGPTVQCLRDRLPEDVSLFVGAHTHKPLQRYLGRTQILNVGSVGSPFDDDVRASYGQLEFWGDRWHTHIVRLPYDRARTERNFMESGFIEQGGPLAKIIFEEWRRARMLLASWHSRYMEAVYRGEISFERGVTKFLQSL